MKTRKQIIAHFRRSLADIRETFAITEHWNDNVRKPGEPIVNPDPDGELERLEKAYVDLLENDKGHGPILFKMPERVPAPKLKPDP
jgi:hypothetical protein